MEENMEKTRKKSKLRIVLCVVAALLIIAVAADIFIGNYLVNYALGRSGDGGNRTVSLDVDEIQDETEKTMEENDKRQQLLTEAFLENIAQQEVSITSDDGLQLKGFYYENTDSHKWAIVVHGYRCDHTDMDDYSERYYDAGYQVLAPDLRACGESEGEYVGMGWLDKDDILKWIDWVVEKDPEAEIVLHGVSMGAATVMMTSGEETPEAVKVFVEDCGYTSVWDIFSSELKLRFHLPVFPILDTANLFTRVKAGYQFKDASALEQVAKCEKPMLFIHGTQDDFVPFEMQDILYEAKPGDNKAKIVAEGAGHTEAADLLGDEYWDEVFDFIEPYLTK